MKFIHFVLNHSKTIRVVRFVLVILGIMVAFSIPREQYPNISLYYVHILVPYPGSSADEIEVSVTQKIESAIKNLPYITNVTSMISDGLSFTRVSYDQSLSQEKFQNEYFTLESKINTVSLPEGVSTPVIDNFTYLDFLPTVQLIVYQSDNSNENETLQKYANQITEQVGYLDGVNRIEVKNSAEQSIGLYFDQKKLAQYQLSLYEVSQAIKAHNISIPAGSIEQHNTVLNIKTRRDNQSLTFLEKTPIRILPNGTLLLLEDIADIQNYYDGKDELLRYNGLPAISLKIFKNEHTDTITLIDDIKQYINEIEKTTPSQISLALFADTSTNINNSIKTLQNNALIGFVLLFLSLLISLGLRPSFIASLEIPFTFATSFLVLSLFGITLNASTLFALVLVLGMVVDHGIVILENITRIIQEKNVPKITAVSKGLSEVGLAVISSSLTTIGAFIPLLFMPGLIGQFLKPIPITITVTLTLSTISALIIIPIHYMRMKKAIPIQDRKIFIAGRKILKKILTFTIAHKAIVCVLSIIISAGALVSLFFLPIDLYETEENSFFFVDFTFPIGSTLSSVDEEMRKYEEMLFPLQEEGTVSNILTLIGNTELDVAEGIRFDKPHNAQFYIAFSPSIKNSDDIIALVTRQINLVDTTLPVTMRIRKQRTGPPVNKDIEFRLLGNNYEDIKTASLFLQNELEQYDEIFNITDNLNKNKEELEIIIDKEQTTSLGLTTAQIGTMIRQWTTQTPITSLFIDNQDVEIIPHITNISDTEREDLSFITFPSPVSNQLVPFDTVVSIESVETSNAIYREQGKRVVKITADSRDSTQNSRIQRAVALAFQKSQNDNNHELITLKQGGEFDDFFSLLNRIIILLIVGVCTVYIILISEFNSYIQPVLIMLTIFFTIVGVSIYLYLSKTPLSITIIYSFMALVGVVVNGAIVLVSRANRLYRDDGALSHTKAIILAAQQRLKPILLTNFTTIFGILPTAIGLYGKSPIWQPMATTMAVGLLFSTITTLVIIPVFYTLLPNHKNDQKKH